MQIANNHMQIESSTLSSGILIFLRSLLSKLVMHASSHSANWVDFFPKGGYIHKTKNCICPINGNQRVDPIKSNLQVPLLLKLVKAARLSTPKR
jgi:hypothetical protein